MPISKPATHNNASVGVLNNEKTKSCCDAAPKDTSKSTHGHVAELFHRYDISTEMKDGYWIEAVDITGTGQADIVAYGKNAGHLNWYRNPNDPLDSEDDAVDGKWECSHIDSVPQPVAMCYAPIASENYNDIVITGNYGPTTDNINTKGGDIWWYRNPLSKGGGTLNQNWDRFCIGRAMGMHRLAIGHFTRTDKWQVLGLPNVGEPNNIHSECATVLFTEPDDLYSAAEWSRELITDSYFHVIHDVVIKKFCVSEKLSGLDSALIASQEGLTWLYHAEGKWHCDSFAKGTTQPNQHGHWGLQNIDVGAYNGDPFAFIASSGPFEGKMAYLYTKTSGPKGTIKGCTWKETQIGLDGDFPILDGDGPIHHVVTGDFTGDGDDDLIYSTRDDGAYFFQIKDFENAVVTMSRLSNNSAARATVADFNGNGRLDFATICYTVDGYYVAKDKYMSVYYNKFSKEMIPTEDGKLIPNVADDGFILLRHVMNSEVLINIKSSTEAMKKWLIDIYGFKQSVFYMPKNSVIHGYKRGTIFKVVYGQVQIQPMPNVAPIIVNNCAYTQGTRDQTIRSQDGFIKANKETIAWVIEPEFDDAMVDFPIIPDEESVNQSIKCATMKGLKEMKFKMVTDADGNAMDFFSLSGFTIRLNNKKISHHTFWIADRGINCGVHDHSGQKMRDAFCEVHSCVVNGTGSGGMFRSIKPFSTPIEEITREDMERIVVPSGYEHGPLWSWDDYGRPARRADGSVKYRPHTWIAGYGDSRSDLRTMDFWIAHKLMPGIVHNSMETDLNAF